MESPCGRGAIVGLAIALCFSVFLSGCSAEPAKDAAHVGAERPPNFVVIFVDDVGWGDLGAYGHPSIRTPSLDRMAAEGQRWTQFYVASPVCSPSRGALLTGRLPVRSGVYGRRSDVFFPGDLGGLPASETTLPEVLSDNGYATAMFGKWHLGDRPESSPLRHGFDTWYGTPYSNDMMWTISGEREVLRQAYYDPRIEYWDLPILRDDVLVEQPADQPYLTRRYTDEAVDFMRAKADQPFFVYLAHSMAHTPLFRSPEYEGHSVAGTYGDVIEEIDWSVGRILDTLRELEIDDHTLVVFTSDNGPWTLFRDHGGSAGPLRGAKGETFEGGMRVPGLFWWPGTIEPEVVMDLGSTLDLLPTFTALSGADPVDDRTLDGVDLTPVLIDGESSDRDEMFYYRSGELWAYRLGSFKLHFRTQGKYGLPPELEEHNPPLLYDVENDVGERWNIAAANPEAIERMLQRIEEHRRNLEPREPEFDRGRGAPPTWK